ncbi:HNH endonuclease domain-containing protein, partial [Vibrio cholerae]|uniref:HNH endonuclease domain-containing protein n=1 Tax=Vibrio cholerae TaxID=666 RepID=UPI003075B4B9
WMLAVECDWTCPYTGQRIDAQSLLGPHPKFDVEHIFPRPYLDDSFGNKSLCCGDFNRNQKKDRLPIDCLGPADYEKTLQGVKAFEGPHAE